MKWLLNFLEEYASHGRTVTGHGKDSHPQLASDADLKITMNEIRTLLDSDRAVRSMAAACDAMRALCEDSQQHERLRHWFRDVDGYVREVLLQPKIFLATSSMNSATSAEASCARLASSSTTTSTRATSTTCSTACPPASVLGLRTL